MQKICLVIVFNHRYDKNIPVLKNLYKDRFSHINFLVPAYNGPDPDVIPVYHASYYFQGYFPEAYNRLKKNQYTHFIFIADDMILNTELNEENIIERLNIGNDTAFITEICTLEFDNYKWAHLPNVVQTMEVEVNRSTPYNARILDFMPSKEDAKNKIRRFADCREVTARILLKSMSIKLILNMLLYGNKVYYKKFIHSLLFNKPILNYPLVYGYSDFIIVPQGGMEAFCQYCGLFAIKNLFVETAIPTALVLTQKHVVTMKETQFERGDLWGEEALGLEKRCDNSLNKLWEAAGRNKLYVHPVKLSRWKICNDSVENAGVL